jgi:hypothetical protein
MDKNKGPGNRSGNGPAGRDANPLVSTDAQGWEARALARVRPHVRELAGPRAPQAGWETETITRLEDYFDRSEV